MDLVHDAMLELRARLQRLQGAERRRLLAAATGALLLFAAALGFANAGRCVPAEDAVSFVQRAMARGQWEEAVARAEKTLEHGRLCSPSRDYLAEAGDRGLYKIAFKKPHTPGLVQEYDHIAAALRDAEEWGKRWKVAPKSRLTILDVMHQAAELGYWDIAIEAWRTAWSGGLINPNDVQAAEKLFAYWFNSGDERVTFAPARFREEGLTRLATAAALDEALGLRRWVAHQRLEELAIPRRDWHPAEDPVLKATERTIPPPSRS